MAKFEFVEKYKDCGLPLPTRATKNAAGYDLYVAEDTVVPSFFGMRNDLIDSHGLFDRMELKEVEALTKTLSARPTLISTGVKCKLDDNQYLEITVRSSTPLKYWLICANGQGIIDADYYQNPSNEGEIFLQLFNLLPTDILLRKGDKIGQGIIQTYSVTEDDTVGEDRKGGFGSTNQ